MTSGRAIGLIGGLGVGAAIHYYAKLAEAHEKHGARLGFVMVHAETSEVFRFVASEDRTGLANYLAGFIHRLAAAGAELAVIPAVTPHFCIHELRSISPLPLVSIFDPLSDYLSTQAINKVAVFGTRFVIESNLYGMIPGVEFVRPRADELDTIHQTYVEVAASRRSSPEAYSRLTKLAQTLCERDGAEAIVLAGTDLALVFDESNTNFPAVDCAALHIQSIVNAALSFTG